MRLISAGRPCRVHAGKCGEGDDIFNQLIQLAKQSGAFNRGVVMMVGIDIGESEGDRVNFSKPGTASGSREAPSFTQPIECLILFLDEWSCWEQALYETFSTWVIILLKTIPCHDQNHSDRGAISAFATCLT